jgi:hypothetical protein
LLGLVVGGGGVFLVTKLFAARNTDASRAESPKDEPKAPAGGVRDKEQVALSPRAKSDSDAAANVESKGTGDPVAVKDNPASVQPPTVDSKGTGNRLAAKDTPSSPQLPPSVQSKGTGEGLPAKENPEPPPPLAPKEDKKPAPEKDTPPPPPPPKGELKAPNKVLLHRANLKYIGAFRVPNYFTKNDEMSFGGSALAYNSTNNSLFLVGKNQCLAEVSIPEAITSSHKLSDLATAKILQPWTPVLPKTPKQLTGASDGVRIGGLIVSNGTLIGTAYAYYSGAHNQVLTHFVLNSLDLSTASVQGLYQVGSMPRTASGYMTPIPKEWRETLGAPYITGAANMPIISTTSSGPAALGFDPSKLGSGVTPATPYVYYPVDHPLGPYTGAANPLQCGTTTVNGAVFVPGTSSVLFFGRTGANFTGYGAGVEFGDHNDGALDGKGPHSLNGEYALQVWAYNANDFVAVKQGKVKPWQVQPYHVWNFWMPLLSVYEIGGVAYDEATARLYVSLQGSDREAPSSYLPTIHVFEVKPDAQVPAVPEIGTLAATPAPVSPGPVAAGTRVLLTAGNVYAVGSSARIVEVAFYRDKNGDGALQPDTDELLGKGKPSTTANADHHWCLEIPTAKMAPGTYTIFARAKDSNGVFSEPNSTTLKIK